MVIYYRDDYEINLLSAEEYEKYKDKIPHINCWWWLRSPGINSSIAAGVHYDGSVFYHGGSVYSAVGAAVRPVLRISDGRKYKIGERVMYYNFPWIIIDKNLAIAEVPIAFHRFDEKSNDYENSEIKKFLNNWLERR